MSADALDDLPMFFGEDDPAMTDTLATPTAPTADGDTNQGERTFDDDVYKKWFRTKDRSGFLTLRTWLEAGKASIDVGELDGSGTLQGHTLVWTNALGLATYLAAVADGNAVTLYPANKRAGAPTPESYVAYGGGKVDNKPVSRVLKIHHWKTGGSEKDGNATYDTSAFAVKCAHFAAREAGSGAFIPDMSTMLSVNQIKMSRVEMAEMRIRLDLALTGFAATYNGDVFRALNGNNR